MVLSELDFKLRRVKIEPQTKEQALANVRKLKADLGVGNKKADKEKVRKILKHAGSMTDEILDSRRKERNV